jgi:putative DNA primase/helicase
METSNFLSRLKDIKKSGPASWMALCPSHPDKQRSLSVSAGQSGILVKCFAGCEPKTITDALGLELRDLFFDNGGNGSHNKPVLRPSTSNKTTPVSPTPNDATRRKPITVCELAAYKKLPEDFLRDTFKMTDSADGVVIPYLNPDGSAFRERLRTTLKAGDGSSWRTGTGQTVYALHLLGKAREAGYAIMVEGESDTWTAHYHGYPALGIPGADGVKVVRPEHLEGLTRVYYVKEPDKGGDTFAVKLPAHLRAIGFTGVILEIRLPA